MVEIWFDSHGCNLKRGQQRREWLHGMLKEMGNPAATRFNSRLFIKWRTAKLEAGVTPSTVNNALACFRAMFRELDRMGEWEQENPVVKIRRIPVKETELAFLDDAQLLALFESLAESTNPDVFLCAALAVSTGARWSEAEGITWDRIRNDRVTYTDTKNGKSRTLPLTACLAESLERRRYVDNPQGRVFRSCYAAYRKAVQRAELKLPRGQLSHVLRHTFASRFMQNGGSILSLQRILGHQSIQMTMRYSHLAPDHFEVVKENNPING